jgi:hypothetical protein
LSEIVADAFAAGAGGSATAIDPVRSTAARLARPMKELAILSRHIELAIVVLLISKMDSVRFSNIELMHSELRTLTHFFERKAYHGGRGGTQRRGGTGMTFPHRSEFSLTAGLADLRPLVSQDL